MTNAEPPEVGPSAGKDATETLRCIYCQRTIAWPVTEPHPNQCAHCGRWTCYTADRPIPSERTQP